MKLQLLILSATSLASTMAVAITGLGDPINHPLLVGGTVEDYDSPAPGIYNSYSSGLATLTGVNGPFTIGVDYNGNYNTDGGQSVYNDNDHIPFQFRIDFSSPVSAFAFNWGAADDTWTLTAYDSGNNVLDSMAIAPTHGSNAGEYFGLAAAGISYATLNNNSGQASDYVFIDDLTYNGGVVATPEVASSLALFGLGLAGLSMLRRKA